MNRPRNVPRLHLVTDPRVIAADRFLDDARELLQAGGSRVALHLRAPSATGRRLYELAEALASTARESGALLMVNDRVDVAMAAEASGIQLGRRGLSIADARRVMGEGPLLGRSVHDAPAAAAAFAAGADFVLAGTLFPSSSHPGRPGSGVAWLEGAVCARGPVIGIGGITMARVREVLAVGAHGIAVVSAVWDAERPRQALLRLLEALDEEKRIG